MGLEESKSKKGLQGWISSGVGWRKRPKTCRGPISLRALDGRQRAGLADLQVFG